MTDDFQLTDEEKKYLEQFPEDQRQRFIDHWRGRVEILPGIIADMERLCDEGSYLKGEHGDYWTEDEVSFKAVDSDGQSLWFRYGAVFGKDGRTGNGIWIEYQKWDLHSRLQGPVLLSTEAFESLISYYKGQKRHRAWWCRLYRWFINFCYDIPRWRT